MKVYQVKTTTNQDNSRPENTGRTLAEFLTFIEASVYAEKVAQTDDNVYVTSREEN